MSLLALLLTSKGRSTAGSNIKRQVDDCFRYHCAAVVYNLLLMKLPRITGRVSWLFIYFLMNCRYASVLNGELEILNS